MLTDLASLILPVALATIAIFFTSFLTWTVLLLHKHDWRKLDCEDEFMDVVRRLSIGPGHYMFPGHRDMAEMKTEAFQKKLEAGPRGVLTIFHRAGMGRNLALTMLYFLVVNFFLAYLASLALAPGAEFRHIFRFVSTAAFMTYLAAIVQHSIWFQIRILGHLIESILYALLTGAIFAALWPAA